MKLFFKIMLPILIIHFAIVQFSKIEGQSMEPTFFQNDYAVISMFSYGIPIPSLYLFDIDLLPDIYGNGHLSFRNKKPELGDVVILRNKVEDKNIKHYIKRCFAKGGDELLFTDKAIYLHTSQKLFSKTVLIDGKEWYENPYRQMNFSVSFYSAFFNSIKKIKSDFRKPVLKNEITGSSFTFNGNSFNALYYKVPENKYFVIGDNINMSNDSRSFGAIEFRDILGKVITSVNFNI